MPNVSVVLDTDDRIASLAAGANPVAGKQAEKYACKHTIIIGKAGADYVAQNFNIAYDLLDKVFEAAGYGDQGGLGITEAQCQLYRYKPAVATVPQDTRSKDASFTVEKRGRRSRAFMGQRVRIPIATVLAQTLYRAPFAPAGVSKPRSSATMLFPKNATVHQIACWMSLNLGPTNSGRVGKFITERGSKVLLKGIADLAIFDKQIGSFKLATANKLEEVPVTELNP